MYILRSSANITRSNGHLDLERISRVEDKQEEASSAKRDEVVDEEEEEAAPVVRRHQALDDEKEEATPIARRQEVVEKEEAARCATLRDVEEEEANNYYNSYESKQNLKLDLVDAISMQRTRSDSKISDYELKSLEQIAQSSLTAGAYSFFGKLKRTFSKLPTSSTVSSIASLILDETKHVKESPKSPTHIDSAPVVPSRASIGCADMASAIVPSTATNPSIDSDSEPTNKPGTDESLDSKLQVMKMRIQIDNLRRYLY